MVPLSAVEARPHRQDLELEPLGKMVGSATVVALTEAVHGGTEPLKFRNRVLQYLVAEKGFTAIAIESGIVESRMVYEYVRGGEGDLAAVATDGISWTMDQLPENHTLIQWIREYNANSPCDRKVNFYGFDVPGSPGNPNVNRGVHTALTEILLYLARVDSVANTAFRARIDSFLPSIRFDFHRPADTPGYDRLCPADRDALTATVADLVALFERNEHKYAAASTYDDYEWAYRAAIGARQVDSWLRQVPVGWKPLSGPITHPFKETEFLSVAADVRDRAQADNLKWIIQREGKVLIFAHRYHLSMTPVNANWLGQSSQQVMGTYLKRHFGGQLMTVGNLIGGGEIECAGRRCCDGIKQTLGTAPAESLEMLAGELGVPLFLLDLRAAPASITDSLEQAHALGRGTLGQGYDVFEVPGGRAFDVLFYLDTVTPACCRKSAIAKV